jgi:hypothetical protein
MKELKSHNFHKKSWINMVGKYNQLHIMTNLPTKSTTSEEFCSQSITIEKLSEWMLYILTFV